MPGGSLCKIQEVILNLRINKMEMMDKKDKELQRYIKEKEIITVVIEGDDAQS